MYFSICNDVNIRNHILKGKESILIRVLEPSYKTVGIPYKINNIAEYKAVLELYLEDTTANRKNTNNEFIFDNQKAKLLNDFILNNDFDEVVIHCSMGISRSPAIMICVAKILNNRKLENIVKEQYKFYNSYIVDTFENFAYSIKAINSIDKIEGNILLQRHYEGVDDISKKMIL